MTGGDAATGEDADGGKGSSSPGYRPGLWRALFVAIVLLGIVVAVFGAVTDGMSGG